MFYVRDKHYSHVASVRYQGKELVVFKLPYSATALDVPPGKYEFQAYSNAIALGMKDNVLPVTLAAGETRYLEWFWKAGWGGGATLIPINPQQGIQAVAPCGFQELEPKASAAFQPGASASAP